MANTAWDERLRNSAFLRGYVECLLWTGDCEDESKSLRDYDFSAEDMQRKLTGKERGQIWKDCRNFQKENPELLSQAEEQGRDMEHLGHDFHLSRNGHGTGFWDRGLGEVGQKLNAASREYGSQYIMVSKRGACSLAGAARWAGLLSGVK